MARLELHRLADRELNEVAQYYDLEKPGLGSSSVRSTGAYEPFKGNLKPA